MTADTSAQDDVHEHEDLPRATEAPLGKNEDRKQRENQGAAHSQGRPNGQQQAALTLPPIVTSDGHAKGCAGRCYECTCGYDNRVEAELTRLTDQLAAAREEVGKLQKQCTALKGRIYGTNRYAANPQEWGLKSLYRGAAEHRNELAAEISTLRAIAAAREVEVEMLRETLKPFAEIADEYHPDEDDEFRIWIDAHQNELQEASALKNFRRARAALAHRTDAPKEPSE